MFKKLVSLGVTDKLKIEQAQIVRLTNIVAMIPLIAYMFYVGYGFYFKQYFSSLLSGSMILLTFLALYFNWQERYGLSKTILFFLNSFSLWVTYHVFNVDYSALTSYFPILFCLPFFFHLPTERRYLLIAGAFPVLSIILSFLLPRQVIYQVNLPPDVAALSNTFHILFSFGLTFLVLYAVFKNRNATQRKLVVARERAELALKQLKETQTQLIHSEKMASLGTLIAGVSHEINNPLNYINGGVDGLRKEIKTIPKESQSAIEQPIALIRQGLDRASGIVKSLNNFSRQSGDLNEQCDLIDILENCLSILSSQMVEKINVRRNYTDREIIIKGNSGKLHQVIINVLSNAIHAIEDVGEIEIDVQKSKDVQVSIRDNGCGISKEDLLKIQDPFFTTKEPGKGLGLGLYISHQIVAEHRGSIHFDSTQHIGTQVIITLPS
ncbi:MAG: GHKL domain-containing protein [Cyclobacteriaceae bacterium]|nr:GHKL domain-containing protein [Cyclobacteriaceae bacterium HetDA_MAG_MS6]